MTIFRARLVCPVDAPPILDGALTVDSSGRIAAIGPACDRPPGPIHDLGHCAIFPGLINAHAHLDLAGPRDEARPRSLWDWFESSILSRRLAASDDVQRAVATGAAASLAGGVTCIADISRTGESVHVLARTPLRACCFVELISGASRPPNDPASLNSTLRRLAPLERQFQLGLGLSPHTPYTVSREDAATTVRQARDSSRPLMMHFLETDEERAWLTAAERASEAAAVVERFLAAVNLPTRGTPPVGSPVAWLREAALISTRSEFAPATILAHVNYADDAVIAALASARVSVAYCPRTHAYFGHPPHRWRDMLATGVNVCIGTDSLASNPDLSILGELRFLRCQAPEIPAQTLLCLATLHGAAAVGWGDALGELAPGRFADFFAVPLPAMMPDDPFGWLLDSDAAAAGTWVGGRRVCGQGAVVY